MDTFTELWKLLDAGEDYARGGDPRFHDEPPPSPYSSGNDKEQRWAQVRALAAEVEACRRCGLSVSRRKTVPGMGALDPQVMIIGEGPGAQEDQTGVPFVGPAGQYLDKWLDSIQLDRNGNCYIGNIVKCRPPGNRDPLPEESAACLPYLRRQIRILQPGAILTLGRTAIQNLLGTEAPLGRLRGQIYEFEGIPVCPTYHPSGVLRNPSYRRPVWEDLKALRGWLEENGLR